MSSKKARYRCAGCHRPMKRAWMRCPVCDRPVMARDRLGKAGGQAVTGKAGARPCAGCRHVNRGTASYCVRCGRPLLAVVKAVSPLAGQREVLMKRIHASSNPAEREGWWAEYQRLLRGPGGAA